MHKTFDTRGNFDECAIRSEIDDLAADAGTNGELILNRIPRIRLSLLETKRNALAITINVEHHDVDLISNLHDFARMFQATPAHIGDMEETVATIEIDECAEIGDVLHTPLANLALLERSHKLCLLFGESTLNELTTRDDKVLTLVRNLDDLELHRLTNVRLKILDRRDFDLTTGQERLHIVDLNKKTTTGRLDDSAGNNTALDITLEDLLPTDLVVGRPLGKDDTAGLVVLKILQHNRDLVAFLNLGTFAELGSVDRTGGLVTNVDEDFSVLDRRNGALDEAAVLELRILRLRENLGHGGGLRRRGRGLSNSHC